MTTAQPLVHDWRIEEREYARQEERRGQDHNATLHVVYRTFGDVRATDEVVAMLEAAS